MGIVTTVIVLALVLGWRLPPLIRRFRHHSYGLPPWSH